MTAKDVILAIIAKIGANGAAGHVIEYAGSTLRAMSIEERLTVCNMSIVAGARAGMVAPDETTYAYLKGRPFAPKAAQWDKALAYWRTLPSDPGAVFDKKVSLDASQLAPKVTWGNSPEDARPMEDEQALISKCLDTLRRFGKVRGWLSPAKSESHKTLDLLAAEGIDYVCDWVNDDMPYTMKTGGRTLYPMPHSADVDDAAILVGMHHDEDEFRDQLIDHFDVLYEESKTQGRGIMAISLHSWATGQPYRIGTLETVLSYIMWHKAYGPLPGPRSSMHGMRSANCSLPRRGYEASFPNCRSPRCDWHRTRGAAPK